VGDIRCIRPGSASEVDVMFKWLAKRRRVNKRASLDRQYRQLLEAARDLQRAGDIQAFAAKTAEAEQCAEQIEAMDAAECEPSGTSE
jgi:hypothetical protein